jgi:GDSL-like Lipase/Acylhydrolase family
MTHRNSILAAVSMLTLAACSAGSHSKASAPTTAPAAATETVLAIGGSATEGDGVRDRLRDAWPYIVFRDDLPASAAFVNGALDDATVAHALATQAPLAQELNPDLVEIWLGADDLLAATPIPAFTFTFTHLVEMLRADGSRRILIGDLPAAYGSRAVFYNSAIHAVVSTTHSELVSLANASITLEPTDGLSPQPDAASHRVIAAAFAHEIAQGQGNHP